MKTCFLLVALFCISLLTPSSASPRKPYFTVNELKKEISEILKNRNLNFLDKQVAQVEVDFLINARNQLVVLDVYGDNMEACEYVKEVLNYKRVNYKQEKQLTRYMVNIRLVKNDQ